MAEEVTRTVTPGRERSREQPRASGFKASRDARPSVEVPEDLGKLIRRDANLVKSMGWEALVQD